MDEDYNSLAHLTKCEPLKLMMVSVSMLTGTFKKKYETVSSSDGFKGAARIPK